MPAALKPSNVSAPRTRNAARWRSSPFALGVLVGEDAVAAGARVVHGGQTGRGQQLRDVRHALAAALALLLGREGFARADLAEDVARQLGDAAGQLAGSSRKKRPWSGSGVSLVMPASSNALVLYQLVWPPRWLTTIG